MYSEIVTIPMDAVLSFERFALGGARVHFRTVPGPFYYSTAVGGALVRVGTGDEGGIIRACRDVDEIFISITADQIIADAEIELLITREYEFESPGKASASAGAGGAVITPLIHYVPIQTVTGGGTLANRNIVPGGLDPTVLHGSGSMIFHATLGLTLWRELGAGGTEGNFRWISTGLGNGFGMPWEILAAGAVAAGINLDGFGHFDLSWMGRVENWGGDAVTPRAFFGIGRGDNAAGWGQFRGVGFRASESGEIFAEYRKRNGALVFAIGTGYSIIQTLHVLRLRWGTTEAGTPLMQWLINGEVVHEVEQLENEAGVTNANYPAYSAGMAQNGGVANSEFYPNAPHGFRLFHSSAAL